MTHVCFLTQPPLDSIPCFTTQLDGDVRYLLNPATVVVVEIVHRADPENIFRERVVEVESADQIDPENILRESVIVEKTNSGIEVETVVAGMGVQFDHQCDQIHLSSCCLGFRTYRYCPDDRNSHYSSWCKYLFANEAFWLWGFILRPGVELCCAGGG